MGTASQRHYLLIRSNLATGELAFFYRYVPQRPASVEEDFRSGNAHALHCGSVPSWFLE
jgi:hypothetical protein